MKGYGQRSRYSVETLLEGLIVVVINWGLILIWGAVALYFLSFVP